MIGTKYKAVESSTNDIQHSKDLSYVVAGKPLL